MLRLLQGGTLRKENKYRVELFLAFVERELGPSKLRSIMRKIDRMGRKKDGDAKRR